MCSSDLLVSDSSEIASVFHLPLDIAAQIDNYKYFELPEASILFPYLDYRGYKIWGFTLKVIVDMLNTTIDAGIKLRYPTFLD